MGILGEKQIMPGEKSVVPDSQLHLALLPDVVQLVTKEEAECLRQLRKLMEEDEDIRYSAVERDDEFLLAFVRGKGCNLEKAFRTLQNYVQVRKVKFNKFFRTLSPRNFEHLYEANRVNKFCGRLKGTDREGRVIGLARAKDVDPRVHKGDHVIQAFVMAGQELLRDHEATKHGLVLVVDAAGFGLRHAREITMPRIYMLLQIFLSAYPVKYKGFHILNNSYIFDAILTVVKQLLPKKLRERIHLHGSSLESLHKHVPVEILPTTFGGSLTDDEAYDAEFELSIQNRTDYYEKMKMNW